MKPILQLMTNLTVVSVFQLIFIQRNYRTVNLYSSNGNTSQSEELNQIIRILTESMIPLKHMNIDEIMNKWGAYEDPILNILAVSEMSDIVGYNKTYLYQTTVIWSISQYEDFSDIMPQWYKLSAKVIVLTNSFLYAANNVVTTKVNKINLLNFNSTVMNEYLKKFFSIENVRGTNIKIFTQFDAPKSELTRIGNNYHMIGPDGIIAEALVDWLNATPTFSSSVEIKHPSYQEWLNSTILLPRVRYQYFHSMVLTKNVVTIFKDSFNSSFDVMLTSFPHQGRNFSNRIGITSETAYPHDTTCLTIIVPQQSLSNQFFLKVMNYADTQAICAALLLFIIFRIIHQKASWHQGVILSIKTIGVFLNQSKIENDSQIKVAWDINLRVFSLLATTALSAIIFKSLVAIDRNEINTIDDLIASNLTVYAPDYLQRQDIWLSIRSSLRSQMEFKKPYDIEHSLVDEQKFDYAYIYPQGKGEYIAMIANAKVPAGSWHRVRLMKEHIYCSLASYRLAEKSPLTPYVNTFLRTFMENGVYVKQLEWMQNLNEAVFHIKQNEPTKRENVVLTMEMIFEVFILYTVGIGIAAFSFLIEITFGYYVYPFLLISYIYENLIRKLLLR